MSDEGGQPNYQKQEDLESPRGDSEREAEPAQSDAEKPQEKEPEPAKESQPEPQQPQQKEEPKEEKKEEPKKEEPKNEEPKYEEPKKEEKKQEEPKKEEKKEEIKVEKKEEKKGKPRAFVEELPMSTLGRIPPADVFPGMAALTGVPKLMPDPSGPTLQSRLAGLGTQEFSFWASVFPKPVGRAVLGWSPAKWYHPFSHMDLVLLPRVLSKGIAWATAYFRLVLYLLAMAFIAGLVVGFVDGTPQQTYAINEEQLLFCEESLLDVPEYQEFLNANVWQVCGYDTEGLDNTTMTFQDYILCQLTLDFFGNEGGGTNYDQDLQNIGSSLKAFNKNITNCEQKAKYKLNNPQTGSRLTGLFAGGLVMTFLVMAALIRMHNVQPGTLAFLRSLAKPDVEEFMLSYAWAKDPEAIRTCAKAIWNSGVGCWIDVCKFQTGDPVRPVIFGMAHRVYRVVVFLSKKYITSPNCAVELMACAQHPQKLIICYLENLGKDDKQDYDAAVKKYFLDLQKEFPAMRICNGFEEVLPILNNELSQLSDPSEAYHWWRHQKITISGAPEDVVPGDPIPRFHLSLKRIDPIHGDLYVGPVYLTGTCRDAGLYFAPPVLLFMTIIGLALVLIDIWNSFANTEHWVYVIFIVLILVAIVPFFEFPKLIDTRRLYCHPSLKPIIASHSFGKLRVPVYVCGTEKNNIVIGLRRFFELIGNGVPEKEKANQSDLHFKVPKNAIKIVVLTSVDERDKYLDRDLMEELENTIIVYDADDNPFGNGNPKLAKAFCEYMVLLAPDQGVALAKSVTAAVATKIISITHKGDIEAEKPAAA